MGRGHGRRECAAPSDVMPDVDGPLSLCGLTSVSSARGSASRSMRKLAGSAKPGLCVD